jgi:hypothetical protein
MTPRSAQASGCHAQDRPTLGLSFDWESQTRADALPLATTARPAPRYVPIPCSGESPASTLRELPTSPPPALLGSIAPSPSPQPFLKSHRHDSPFYSCHGQTRLDRPPKL